MFCGKCGTQVNDGVKFCPGCGAALGNPEASEAVQPTPQPVVQPTPQQVYIPETQAPKEGKISNKKLRIAIIAVILLGAIVGAYFLFFGSNGPTDVLDKLFEAHEEHDVDIMIDEVYADITLDSYIDAYSIVEDAMDDAIYSWGCGEDITITYKIEDEERVTGEDLAELKEDIYDWYDVSNPGRYDITDAYEYEIIYTVKGSERTVEYETDITMIKENGEWHML